MNQPNASDQLSALEEQIIERTREIERRRAVAEGLRGILAVLNSNRPLEQILDFIVSEARRLLEADAAAIYRLQPDGILTVQSSQGLSPDYLAQSDIPLGELFTGRAVQNLQPVAVNSLEAVLSEAGAYRKASRMRLLRKLAEDFHSILSVPLITNGEPAGALTLYYAHSRPFNEDEIGLAVAFCDQSALAIENARLREHLREEAINAERSRLARELHDSVTQMLFSASLIAEVLPAVWKRDLVEGQRALDELRQLTRGSLAEMRAMLLELRPAGLEDARLENLLRQLAEAVTGRTRIPVQVQIEPAPALPPPVRLAFYRISQEALNNVAKHSGALSAGVELRVQPLPGNRQQVDLTIWDTGYGFNPSAVHSDQLGLSIMRERAAAAGANISIQSKPGGAPVPGAEKRTIIRVTWTGAKEEERAHEN
jgi:signal transduction histidine kinase